MGALNRTGHEYYSEMPKFVRKRWSDNRKRMFESIGGVSEEKFLDKTYYDHRDFILSSFRWRDTNEGVEYWASASFGDYEECKSSTSGTVTFVALLLIILSLYAIVWSAFYKPNKSVIKNKVDQFVPVTVWEKADTMDMVYADKNYKGK